jgi:hypothetical protein
MTYFQTKNPNLGGIFDGVSMEDVGIFYGHLDYFMAMSYVLWPFGMVCSFLVYFSPFWYVVPRNIWQPCSKWMSCQRGETN